MEHNGRNAWAAICMLHGRCCFATDSLGQEAHQLLVPPFMNLTAGETPRTLRMRATAC
jgi:hypothetical protein